MPVVANFPTANEIRAYNYATRVPKDEDTSSLGKIADFVQATVSSMHWNCGRQKLTCALASVGLCRVIMTPREKH